MQNRYLSLKGTFKGTATHKFRSAWKWYGWIGIVENGNFLNLNFGSYLNLSSPSNIAKSVFHALLQLALYFWTNSVTFLVFETDLFVWFHR